LALDGFGAAIVPATAVPTWLTGAFRRINVPELPRRVVASIRRRRPTPSAPTHVALETLAHVIAEQGVHQPGVHPETGNLLSQRSG
jgi:LysR family hydrogen peroxide-inducible transcriptional activator